MVRFVEINYVFQHPFEKVNRAYFQKVRFFQDVKLKVSSTSRDGQIHGVEICCSDSDYYLIREPSFLIFKLRFILC